MSLVNALSQFSTCKTMGAPPASAPVVPLTLRDSGPGSSEHHDTTMPSLHQKKPGRWTCPGRLGRAPSPWQPCPESQPGASSTAHPPPPGARTCWGVLSTPRGTHTLSEGCAVVSRRSSGVRRAWVTGRRGQSWDCAPPQIPLTLQSTAPQAGKGEGIVAESTTLTSQLRATHQTPHPRSWASPGELGASAEVQGAHGTEDFDAAHVLRGESTG